MKTLADLKRYANKYEWSLTSNSWYPNVPEFQSKPRRVKSLQSTKFSLLTNKDGQETESWIDFPKASEIEIKHHGLSTYELTIKRELQTYGDDSTQYHTMKYRLTPILELFDLC